MGSSATASPARRKRAASRIGSFKLIRYLVEPGLDRGLVDPGRTRHWGLADDIIAHLLPQVREGDVVVIMSNGGFGGIHEKLLAALRGTTGKTQLTSGLTVK